jgi:hypothetical protein
VIAIRQGLARRARRRVHGHEFKDRATTSVASFASCWLTPRAAFVAETSRDGSSVIAVAPIALAQDAGWLAKR